MVVWRSSPSLTITAKILFTPRDQRNIIIIFCNHKKIDRHSLQSWQNIKRQMVKGYYNGLPRSWKIQDKSTAKIIIAFYDCGKILNIFRNHGDIIIVSSNDGNFIVIISKWEKILNISCSDIIVEYCDCGKLLNVSRNHGSIIVSSNCVKILNVSSGQETLASISKIPHDSLMSVEQLIFGNLICPSDHYSSSLFVLWSRSRKWRVSGLYCIWMSL